MPATETAEQQYLEAPRKPKPQMIRVCPIGTDGQPKLDVCLLVPSFEIDLFAMSTSWLELERKYGPAQTATT